MGNQKITVALLVLALSFMLFFADNTEFAYAISVVETLVNNATTVATCVGYHSLTDTSIVYSDSTNTFYFIDASDGTILDSTASSLDCLGTTVSTTDLPTNGIVCTSANNICIFAVLASASNIRLGVLDLSDYSVTIYAPTGTDFAGCRPASIAYSGGQTAKAVMAVCSNPALNGLYTINYGLISSGGTDNDVFVQIDNTTPSSGLTSSCYDSTTNKAVFSYASGSAGGIRTVTSGGTVTFVDATDDVDQVTCNSGFAIGIGNGADTINIFNLATNTVSGTTTGVTNGHVALRHGDNVYVTFDASTTINIYGYSPTGAMTQTGTILGFDNAGTLLSGNSTRIEALGITGTNLSHYVIAGLDNDGSEPEETPNQVDGICGVGTALECVGDRNIINAITGAPALTETVTDLGNGLGIFNSTNTDPETNGSGLFLMLATGVFFFAISVSTIGIANSKFNANIQYSDSALNPYYLLFLVVGVVALSWYLNWIPDIVFYGMVVGLAGLFAFGIYRQIGRG